MVGRLYEKHLPLANSAQNIPQFPDIPDAAPQRPGMSGKTGMFWPHRRERARFPTSGAAHAGGSGNVGNPGNVLATTGRTYDYIGWELPCVVSHLEYALPLWVGASLTEITTIREATTERVRLHRERRRRGLRCLTIEIRDREIDALVRHGLLDGEKRDDTTAIRAAFHQYLDHTLGLC